MNSNEREMSCLDNLTTIASTIPSTPTLPSILETLAALQIPYSLSPPSTSTSSASFFNSTVPISPFPQSISSISAMPPPSITIDPLPVQPSLLPPSSIFSSLTTPANINVHASELVQLLASAASSSSPSRRLSCPETSSALRTSLEVPTSSDRRRYSDGYTVDAILRDSFLASQASLHFTCPASTAGVYPSISTEQVPPTQRRASGARKQRTIYCSRQTEVLEEAFHSQKYMVGAEREFLATRLGLSEAQVRVWFQNRRSKHRKMSKGSADENK